jgi:hypothetical protein
MNKKKILIVVTAFLMTATAYSQEKEPLGETDSQKRLSQFNSEKRHEVGLDVFSAILFPAFNPRYEYVLSKHSGIGMDINIYLSDTDSGIGEIETFSITPFYRQYFFSKEDYGAKGFYGEGFLKFYQYNDSVDSSSNGNSNETSENFNELALGIGIGWKWVSDSGFLIDIGFGVGRNLGIANYNEDIYGDRPIAGRGSINFGWRF